MDADRQRGASAATTAPPKTNGTHPFTLDVKLPGMLTAVMIHPPKFGASAASFDAAAAKAMPGVVDVVQTPRGVAVVGEHMWAALKGARRGHRASGTRPTPRPAAPTRSWREYRELAAGAPAAIALEEGDSRRGDGRARRRWSRRATSSPTSPMPRSSR